MRGEKRECRYFPQLTAGSPPHARGKGCCGQRLTRRRGITPACAGKRVVRAFVDCPAGDHPRMRGEKWRTGRPFCMLSGSPPHARGKVVFEIDCISSVGITPACAGKSRPAEPESHCPWDHPRMRGEKMYSRTASLTSLGSPPHARGKD